MRKVTFQQVKKKCGEGRYFSYKGINDAIFVPPSVFFIWIFVSLGWSGNAVSILSGLIALIGGVLVASSNFTFVIIGSFGYMLYYFLDYVDGGVSRYLGKSGIGGQYMDWTMHVVSAVGFLSGLFAGAIIIAGPWIIPFGILTVVAAALSLDRYSLGWFSICMHYQQQRVKGIAIIPIGLFGKLKKTSLWFRGLRYLISLIFHEDNIIFLLPVLAFVNHFWLSFLDFRVILIVIGGSIYFPVVIYDIWIMASTGRIENGYNKLFLSDCIPNLPNDLYFH